MGRTGMIHSEFRRAGLADDECPCSVQRADSIRVFGWPTPTQASAAVFGRHVAGVEHILHADWQTMQRANRESRRLPFICLPRALARQIDVQEAPGLHLRFANG